MTKQMAGEIWNGMCFYVNKHKNSSEKEFQLDVKLIFEKLGWSSFKGEIECEKKVKMGATNKKADIVLKNNDEPVIVIELKRPNKHNSNEAIKQLSSYMRQLGVKFGIFIGENLQFYYDEPNTRHPTKVFETDFIEDDKNAAEFISLLDKTSKPFGENKILEFCEKRILNEEDKEKFEELKSEITDGNFDSEVKNLFIEFLKKKYSEQIANKISNEIEVEISLKKPSARNEKSLNGNNQKSRKSKHFTFDMVGIKPGTTLVFTKDEREKCKVEDDKYVRYKNEIYSLTGLAKKLRHNDDECCGPNFFKVKDDLRDETLTKKRKRMFPQA
jgi:hypothetical protein